jgi:hypothetical protein
MDREAKDLIKQPPVGQFPERTGNFESSPVTMTVDFQLPWPPKPKQATSNNPLQIPQFATELVSSVQP